MDVEEDFSEDEFYVNRTCAASLAAELSKDWEENAIAKLKMESFIDGAKGKNSGRRAIIEKEIRARRRTNNKEDEDALPDDRVEVSARVAKRRKKSSKVISEEDQADFVSLNLSKPILKALSQMNHTCPTPIQLATIPLALSGRDVCGCAVTGSGKTLAFLIPVVERLLYKPKGKLTRVLILTPTRELAVQTCQVARQLCQFMPCPVDICMAIGGFDLKAQEKALRLFPDIVIATPGRLIDHVHNSPSFSLHTIEILILDEADRMLDEYFADQMNEVIRLCAKNRQTLLFSATLSEKVKDLAAVSLSNPVSLSVDHRQKVAPGVCQEFIRIRPNQEGDREAILLALITRVCPKQTIVFVQTKKLCHRLYLLLALMNVKAEELHGNVPQHKRVDTLQKFKNKEVDVLLATDLAARGLDIVGVQSVINFTMPNTFKHYIHRVGRTARAGQKGRSISMCGDAERRLLKEIIKSTDGGKVLRRIVPAAVVAKMRQCVDSVENDIKEIVELEKNEKLIEEAEKELRNTENKLLNKEEPPKRSWFQTPSERKALMRQRNLTEHSGKIRPDKTAKKQIFRNRKDMDNQAEDRVKREIEKTIKFNARLAKKGIVVGNRLVKKPKGPKSSFNSDLSTKSKGIYTRKTMKKR